MKKLIQDHNSGVIGSFDGRGGGGGRERGSSGDGEEEKGEEEGEGEKEEEDQMHTFFCRHFLIKEILET